MATIPLPALDIHSLPLQSPLDQQHTMAINQALQQQTQSAQQLQPLQVQQAQQTLESGQLDLQAKQIALQSQKAMSDAMKQVYGGGVDDTSMQPAPATLGTTAPAPSTTPSPATGSPSKAGLMDISVTSPAATSSTTPTAVATPDSGSTAASDTGSGSFSSLIGKMTKVAQIALANGADGTMVMDQLGKSIATQKQYADMTATEHATALSQNKAAGERAANILQAGVPILGESPAQTQQREEIAYGQAQRDAQQPNAAAVYGPAFAHQLATTPYPGHQAIVDAYGGIQLQSDLLDDATKRQDLKLKGPLDAQQIQEFNLQQMALAKKYGLKGDITPYLAVDKDTPAETTSKKGTLEALIAPAKAGQVAGAEAGARLSAEEKLSDYNHALALSSSLQKDAIEKVNGAFTDPQHGYTQFLAQAQETKNNLANAKNGDELAASMVPLMTALNVTSFAGVHRINQNEINAAGPELGSYYRQLNSYLDKAATGSLPSDTAAEMGKMVDGMIVAKHDTLVRGAAQQVSNSNFGLRPNQAKLETKNVTVLDRQGNLVPLDAAVNRVSKDQAPKPQPHSSGMDLGAASSGIADGRTGVTTDGTNTKFVVRGGRNIAQ